MNLRLFPTSTEFAEAPKVPLVALIAANLVPLVGVVAFGWDLGLILLLFWGESVIVFAFSILKMARAAGLAAFALVPFFLVHAGMFMGGHLVFLLALFVGDPRPLLSQLALPLAVLALSHGVSFVVNALRGGERLAKATDAMSGFYARIVVMHLAIIFGGFAVMALGSPAWALALLVVLKIGVDAAAHVRERAARMQAASDGWIPVEPAKTVP
jgi:hypothetical protein